MTNSDTNEKKVKQKKNISESIKLKNQNNFTEKKFIKNESSSSGEDMKKKNSKKTYPSSFQNDLLKYKNFKKQSSKKPPIIPEKKYPIEYKRLGLLRHFVTKYGKIRPRRVSKIPLKQQRKVAKAIRRARAVGLIPCSMIAKS